MRKQAQAVLFDLDGTLMDTAADLGKALNRVLKAQGLEPISLAKMRPEAGQGARGLLKLGMNVDKQHPQYDQLVDELLNYYHEHMLDTTQLFPGMETVLRHLDLKKIPWGVVTNKPERFTTVLMQELNLTQRAYCIISGDTLPLRKPDPQQLLHACDLLQIDPQRCLYVGDSEVDVIASRAANMPVLVALYGYIPQYIKADAWKADGYISNPIEVLDWIDKEDY